MGERLDKTEGKKVRFSIKNLTKKQKILLIVGIVVVAAAIALSIALPLTLGRNEIPEPYFLRFDQNSDSQLTLQWNAVKGATSYQVEYYFEGSDSESSYVTGTRFYIDRKAGVLYARVRAIGSRNNAFSEYARQEIDALVLGSPKVTIAANGKVEWTPVYYKYRGERIAVKNYSLWYQVGNANTVFLCDEETLSRDIADVIVQSVPYDSELEEYVPWEDVTITVGVKARTDIDDFYTPTKQEIFLKGAYIEGEIGIATLKVTKDLYEEMKK